MVSDPSLYLDTSYLLKLLFPEPESARTAALIAGEERVVASALGRLETLVQVQGRVVGKHLTASVASQLRDRLAKLLDSAPFASVACPADIMAEAEAQMRRRPRAHCRTLDRLHLACMESLGLRRMLTNDDGQASAARALGLEVTVPR